MAARSSLLKLFNCSQAKSLASGYTVYQNRLVNIRNVSVPWSSPRSYSSASSEDAAATGPSDESAGSSAPGKAGRMMPFEEYTKQRYRLKWSARLAGIPGFMVGSGISAAVNVHLNPQIADFQAAEVEPVFGMDPLVFAALCGLGSGIVGFIGGAAAFNALWRVIFREQHRRMVEREKDFQERIQKYRFSAFSRYEDDYYGDKVKTLSDYRQWVRQQRKRKESQGKFASSPEANTA